MSRLRHLVGGPAEPLFGDLPRVSTTGGIDDRTAARHVDPAAQWADTIRSAWTDWTVDGQRLLGRPRSAVGFVREVSGDSIAGWARAECAPWRLAGMTDADWARAAALVGDWVRAQEAAHAAAVPADQRRADEIAAQRRAADRRAELEAQRAAADAELAELDAGHVPAAPAPATSGWLRRPIRP